MVYAFPDAVERICSNGDEEEAEDFFAEPTPSPSVIQQFYEGASVFITGGTGFVGMSLVEKLLRSCPGIKRLFLLIRAYKGKTARERATEMFLNPLFAPLLEHYPKILEKVRIVPGNVEQANLGISFSDIEMLRREVDIVFNVAATVRFDEPIREAFFTNVVSLRATLALAESMPNLKAFVHASTAFSQSHRLSKHIREKFYPSPYSELEIETLLNSADDYTVRCLSRLILGRMPNAYTLTKAMGEEIVRQKSDTLPIAIYRPSIVLNSNKEPVRGWNCTFQGAGAIFLGIGLGVLRAVCVSPTKQAEIIPVDKCACALAAIPWHMHTSRQSKLKMTPIYNHVNNRNPITWGQTYSYLQTHMRSQRLASKFQVWVMRASFESNRLVYSFKFFFYHLLPLPLFGLAEKLQNQPPRLRKIYLKMVLLDQQLSDFTQNDWFFDDNNIQCLWSCMPSQDRRIFDLEITTMDWIEYFQYISKGYGFYVMKETWTDLKQSRRKFQTILMMDRALVLIFKVLKIYFAYKTGILLYNLIGNYVKYKVKHP